MTTANFNPNDTMYAGANGVVIWKSLDRPLVLARRLNRGDEVTVAERLTDGWLRVQLPDGTPGFVQANALTAAPFVAPISAPSPAPTASALASVSTHPAPAVAAATAPAPTPEPSPQPRPTPATPSPDAFCGTCGRALVPGNAFCGGCGASVATRSAPALEAPAPAPVAAPAAAPAAAPPLASPPPYQPQPHSQPQWPVPAPNMAGMQSAVSAMQNPDYIGYAIVNLVLIISAFLPWEVVDLFFVRATGSGLDVNRGWIVLVTAFVAGAIAVWGAIQPVPGRLVRWAQFGAGIAAVAMVFFEFNAIGNYCGDRSDCEVGPGIGVFLAFLAALALIALAIFRPLNRWRARQSVA